MLVGLCLITGLAGRSLLAGLAMAVLGLLIAMVGIDPVRGAPRFTFGIPSLYDGVGFIPVVMGLFGVAEILLTIEKPYRQVIKTNLSSLLPSREEWRRSVGAIGRGTGIGFFLGPDPRRRRHHPDLRGLRRSRSASPRRRRDSARAPSRAWPRLRPPTTPTPTPP